MSLWLTIVLALGLAIVSLVWPTNIWWITLTVTAWTAAFLSNCYEWYTVAPPQPTGIFTHDLAATAMFALFMAIPLLVITLLRAMAVATLIGVAVGYNHFHTIWATAATALISAVASGALVLVNNRLVPTRWLSSFKRP